MLSIATTTTRGLPMIRRIKISNFRSIGADVTLDLGQLTALVGPNGSGKSNVVDALRFVADCMKLGLEGAVNKRHGIQAIRRWSAGRPFNVELRVEISSREHDVFGYYSFELTGARAEDYRVATEEAHVWTAHTEYRYRVKNGEWDEGPSDLRPAVGTTSLALPLIGGDERFEKFARILRGIAVYTVFPDTLREPQKYDPTKPMHEHGANWISILKDQDRNTWAPELLAALGRLTGDIEDIRIISAAGYHLVEFKHASGHKRPKWFEAAQESDGTLRVAGIVTALLQEPPLPLLGIEEPELTVHPGAIPLLYDFIHEAQERSQIIVTTHSPELLDLLDTDAIRVVTMTDGETRLAAMDDTQRQSVAQGLMSLGEVMRVEGIQPQLNLPAMD